MPGGPLKKNSPSNIKIPLLPHQLRLLNSRSLENALVGGMGSGKTQSGAYLSLKIACANPGKRTIFTEPTSGMVHDILIPKLGEVFDQCRVRHRLIKSPYPEFIVGFDQKFRSRHNILLRSGENYDRLRSLEACAVIIDEADTMKDQDAENLWNIGISRLRQGDDCQIFVLTTPEGFKFVYRKFVTENKDGGRLLIKSKTKDNFFLPKHYAPLLLKNYPPHLIDAYLNGEFVPMKGERVYCMFDRSRNSSDYTLARALAEGLRLHIGVDFNVIKKDETGGMSAITHIIDGNGDPHAIDEILHSRDTPTLAQAINNKYEKFRGSITIYPDASARNRSSKSAGVTDIYLLQDAGLTVCSVSANPLIRDRVNSMNAQFLNSEGLTRYRVNLNNCPGYVQCLEQQGYGPDGMPEKGQWDGPVDAAGYMIFYLFGVDAETRSVWIGKKPAV